MKKRREDLYQTELSILKLTALLFIRQSTNTSRSSLLCTSRKWEGRTTWSTWATQKTSSGMFGGKTHICHNILLFIVWHANGLAQNMLLLFLWFLPTTTELFALNFTKVSLQIKLRLGTFHKLSCVLYLSNIPLLSSCVTTLFDYASPRLLESSEELKDYDRTCIYVDSQFQAEDSFTVRNMQSCQGLQLHNTATRGSPSPLNWDHGSTVDTW